MHMSLHHLGRIAIVSTILTVLCGSGCMRTRLDTTDNSGMEETVELRRCYTSGEQSQHCKELIEKDKPNELY